MDEEKDKSKKWDFSDYAYTITGIIVAVLLIGPQLLENLFGISFTSLDLDEAAIDFAESLDDGRGVDFRDFNQMRMLSPMLFLVTTTLVFIKEAFDARHGKVYEGTVFTHTFESLFEEALYMVITTVMVLYAIFNGTMYVSWLAGPITWILHTLIFPLFRKRDAAHEREPLPYFFLAIFAVGIIVEIITQAWIAFPLVWIIICALKGIDVIRHSNRTVNDIYDILYYAFSVILISAGLIFDFWIASWLAFPLAAFICWIIDKVRKTKAKRELNR